MHIICHDKSHVCNIMIRPAITQYGLNVKLNSFSLDSNPIAFGSKSFNYNSAQIPFVSKSFYSKCAPIPALQQESISSISILLESTPAVGMASAILGWHTCNVSHTYTLWKNSTTLHQMLHIYYTFGIKRDSPARSRCDTLMTVCEARMFTWPDMVLGQLVIDGHVTAVSMPEGPKRASLSQSVRRTQKEVRRPNAYP